jgi:hypothetical protein
MLRSYLNTCLNVDTSYYTPLNVSLPITASIGYMIALLLTAMFVTIRNETNRYQGE